MLKSQFLLLSSAILLTACNSPTTDILELSKASANERSSTILAKPKKTSLLNTVVNVNNTQFKVLSKQLTTSSKLFNLKTSSVGSVSGSFIVFSTVKPIPDKLGLNFNDDAQQIAHKTWRFTANRGEDFLLLYKQLQQNFSKVEMTINYGNNTLDES
ncbi:MAG: hypothetical protein HRU25_04270 [Psychrobium sp.]|nr:hypothetical protein [Psychrobium sp.]